MRRSARVLAITICLLGMITTAAAADETWIIDPVLSGATMANSPAFLALSPGGHDGFLNPVDHTIDVYIYSYSGFPIETIASDIWLMHPDVVWCPGGTVADSSTFAPDPGHTTFTGTPRGGVNPDALCDQLATDVVALGFVIETLELGFSSMDLDGSGAVNLVDFARFAQVFNTDFPCADYHEGTGGPLVTLVDFAVFASVYNDSQCP